MAIQARWRRHRRFDVAAIAETSGGLGREIYCGIARYLGEHPNWNLHVEVGTAERMGGIEHWSGDGLIARPRSKEVWDGVAAMNVPRVVIGMVPIVNRAAAPLAQIWLGNASENARLVYDYFALRGFRHFAFVSFPPSNSAFGRDKPLREILSKAGVELRQYRPQEHHAPDVPLQVQMRSLAGWLRQQPTPLAVWAANDLCGQQVIDACRIAGLSVPEQVAIIGHGNDDLLCRLCTPQLSSIHEPYEAMGYEAARILQRLMTGRRPPARPKPFKPIGIVTRQSSDLIAIEDRDVAMALRTMRDRLSDPSLDVTQLANALSISRSTLQRKFRRAIGRSPGQELARLRIERARELVTTTTLSFKQIAMQCGYGALNRMYDAFKRSLRTTPSRLRRSR